MSHNIVSSLICHKYIHIMGWKDQTRKEIATCWNLASLSSCCEQAAAEMLKAFPVHFVPLQSNSTQFLKENYQNSTWKSLYVSHNTSNSQICHKYIHIMAWKNQKRKQKATCGKFVSPQQLLWASCCWDAQGISCSFCAIAIQQHTV